MEGKRGEWRGGWGEGEEGFEEEGVRGAGGEHELERGGTVSGGIFLFIGEAGETRGERYGVSALLVFPWYTAGETGC